MTGAQAIEALKQWGYQFSLKEDGRIAAILPGGLSAPKEAEALLDDIRLDRESAVTFLKDLAGGAEAVQSETQLFRSGNLCAFLALLWDVHTGKVQLTGDVVYHTATGLMEAFWRPLEPLPFFTPSLSGRNIVNFISERMTELHREARRELPIAQKPRLLMEEALLESLLSCSNCDGQDTHT